MTNKAIHMLVQRNNLMSITNPIEATKLFDDDAGRSYYVINSCLVGPVNSREEAVNYFQYELGMSQ